MKLIIFIIFAGLLTVSLANAEKNHPFGHSIPFELGENSEELSNSTFNKFKEIFTHPEVENRKVVVLSIIGAYRKGKSFFLDYCLRFLYANYRSINTLNQTFVKKENWWGTDNEPLLGFSWKHGSVPDTKGIIFWSDVFLHEQNGEEIAIFLIDTQGLFETGRDRNLDAKIFGITNFISSIQIFNIKDVIQEDQLEHLKMVTDYAKLTTKRQDEKLFKINFRPFQNLLFLFRDWEYEDIDLGYEGGQIYLERFLNANNTNEQGQIVRNNIKQSYDQINSFLLPSPGKITHKKTYNGRWGPLDDDFKEHFIVLIESIFMPKNLVKKKVIGIEITTKELLNYTLSIFATFDSSDLPESDSILDVAVKLQLSQLSEQSVQEYFIKMNQSLDITSENFATKLLNDHELIKGIILKKLRMKPKMADEETEKKFIEDTKIKINGKFLEWKTSVDKLNQDYLEHKRYLEHLAWVALQQRREGARANYARSAAYQSCRFFTMYMHDCGMTHNVNSVT